MADYYNAPPYDPVHASSQAAYHADFAHPQPTPHHQQQQALHHQLNPSPVAALYDPIGPPIPLPMANAYTDYSPPPLPPALPAAAPELIPVPVAVPVAVAPMVAVVEQKPKRTRRSKQQSAPAPQPTSDYDIHSGMSDSVNPDLGPSCSSSTAPRVVNIKTKFPVARIKRIMQADEDVGKVAQVTPVVVSKALELFMIALCDKASEQARQRNSKRVTAGHLKQAIVHEEQFDFLADIIEKVPDIPVASENAVHSNGDSEDGAVAERPVKKAKKPRTKKVKDEDSF